MFRTYWEYKLMALGITLFLLVCMGAGLLYASRSHTVIANNNVSMQSSTQETAQEIAQQSTQDNNTAQQCNPLMQALGACE